MHKPATISASIVNFANTDKNRDPRNIKLPNTKAKIIANCFLPFPHERRKRMGAVKTEKSGGVFRKNLTRGIISWWTRSTSQKHFRKDFFSFPRLLSPALLFNTSLSYFISMKFSTEEEENICHDCGIVAYLDWCALKRKEITKQLKRMNDTEKRKGETEKASFRFVMIKQFSL